MITDSAVREMLTGIFPEKLEPPIQKLSQEFITIIEIAEKYTENNIPPIVIESGLNDSGNPKTGCVDYGYYSTKTIRIWDHLSSFPRGQKEILRTLAHELGHIIDGRHYGFDNENFVECEKAANHWKEIILSEYYS